MVLSESESIFGMHQLWDQLTRSQMIQAAWEMAVVIVNVVYMAPNLKNFLTKFKINENVLKAVLYALNPKLINIISASTDEAIELLFKNTELNWLFKMVSAYNDLVEIFSDFDFDQSFYPQFFDCCIEDLDYSIYMELRSGERHELRNIRELMSNI